MRILKINTPVVFAGIRQDRNTVSQLKQDNPYDLNVPNQRRINNAIEELSKIGGEDNVNFLLDVSENLKYGTNIDLGKKPYNDWRAKLNKAAEKSLKNSDKSVRDKLAKRLNTVINSKKEYTREEKEILVQRELLFDKIDREALSKINNANTRNFNRNLNYFIISSEVPTSQKLYILKRLNYLMSDDYKINPQLADKKTQVVAEIVNDIVINTPESKVPNIKAINQKQHGMCGAISVSRKALAYEDKVNYVDMLMSELDDTPMIQVYDRTKLGSKAKIPVPKAQIDYDYALSKGYRIVDASVMNWMNVGDTVGAFNEVVGAYTPFDKENFETFADTHILQDIDEETVPKQDFYRSLAKAKEVIGKYKKEVEKQKYLTSVKSNTMEKNIQAEREDFKVIREILRHTIPDANEQEIRYLGNSIVKLNIRNMSEKDKLPENIRKYSYVNNEPIRSKIQKITAYISDYTDKNIYDHILFTNGEDIIEAVTDINSKNHIKTSTHAQNYRQAKNLYEAAAAYRTQQVFQLDIPEYLQSMMQQFNIPDEESLIIENLNNLSDKLRKNKINPVLKEKLKENFSSEIDQIKETQDVTVADDIILADVLDEYAQSVNTLRTTIADDLYSSLLLHDRKYNLGNQLQALQLTMLNESNKDMIQELATDLGVKNNKYAVIEHINKLISVLTDKNCTEEQYIQIFNQAGHKSELRNLYSAFNIAHSMMFERGNEKYIKGFNLINGAPENSPIETTEDIYKVLAKSFDNMSFIIKTLQNTLQIEDENGEVLNTADPKSVILKKLENRGELPTKKELESFRQKFNAYAKLRYDDEYNRVKFSHLPKDVTTFSNFEKEALKKYSKNINSWYYTVTRRLTDSYRDLKEPLEELNRDIGVKTGEYWLKEGESGLSSVNSAKILEHMTGRPYYLESNGRVGIEKAKNSPYSLNSSTHVMHTEIAPHAQYVVDIKPVEIKTGKKTETKDIILHDNTWGAAEHENVWIDENGFTRTDYSSGYGGEKGYITDNDYRNGNLAENLLDKYGHYVPEDIPTKAYKKLNRENEELKFSLFKKFIVQGTDPGAQSTVSNIKLKLLLPSDELIDDLTEYAKNMTREEIKSAMLRISTAGETSRTTYKKMLEEIKGTDEIINKGITSQEDYDKLSDNNPLKIALEKSALYASYNKIPDYKKFAAETKTMAEIKKLKDGIRTDARKNFDYILGNHPDVIRYFAEASRKEINALLQDFSDKRNLKLTTNDLIEIVNEMKKVKKEDFDGNIDHSINIAVNNFKNSMNKRIKNKLPNQEEQINDLGKQVYKIIQNKTIITKNDINALGSSSNFIQWLDREFNPKTDDEFAQILINLRKMTAAEFNRKYSETISDTDLDIKNITGYDMAKMIRNENSAARRTFVNTVFMQEYYKDVHLAKVTPYYELTKFGRRHSGDSYKNGKRTFDDIYIDYYYNLELLNLGKMFAKHKDEGYRKYGVFPAYPQVQISTEEAINNVLDDIYGNINNYMGAVSSYELQIKNAKELNRLNNYINEYLPQDGELTDYQYKKVKKILKNVFTQKGADPIYQEAYDKYHNILKSGSRSIPEFREMINFAYDKFETYSVTLDGKTMEEAKQARLADIEAVKASYVRTLFEPKYQGKAFELLNKWVSAKSKAAAKNSDEDFAEADKIYDKFKELFNKHRLLLSPEKYLQEYLMLCAKDTTPKSLNIPEPESKDAQEEFESIRQTYKESLESLLGKADMLEMQEILMNCAEKGNLNAVRTTFKNSTLALKDGSIVPLDSEEALAPLIAPMLAESNLDTAALFVNQLGLSENIAKAVIKNPPYDEAYKNADRIQSMLRSVDSQAKFILKGLKTIGDLDKDPNYKQKVEQYRQEVINKAKRTNYRRTVKTYEAAFNEAYELFDKFPKMSRNFILNASIEAALQEIRSSLTHNIDVLNQPMKILQTRTRLLEKLVVPDNTDMIDVIKEYFEKYQKLVEYIDATTGAFPNIGLHTEE